MKSYVKYLLTLKNKSSLTFILILLTTLTGHAATFNGWWRGEVMKLPIVLHIDGKRGCLYSPAQTADSIPFSRLTVTTDSINFAVDALQLSYSGKKSNGNIVGHLQQGIQIGLTFSPASASDATLYRPQTPQPPFFYNIENVTFPSDTLTLAGTLTYPYRRPFGAIVLVSGSGSQNRDEEIAGHKPFAVIADILARCGWASVRYDDRGVGGSSKGGPSDTTLDFANDAMAAVSMLRQRFPSLPIGILGHSEGGTIAMINAAQHPDSVDFIISLAGMAIPGRDLMIRQNEMMLDFHGAPQDEQLHRELVEVFDYIASDLDDVRTAEKIDSIMKRTTPDAEQRRNMAARMTAPWYRQFIRLNPPEYLKKINCPMLALNGTWDIQVESGPNLQSIATNVPTATIVELPGLNHLFQESPSKRDSFNYSSISQTISPTALDKITNFLTVYLRSRK